MAGEIEEPIMLDFEADSLHSGSISFGRFESEVLCWERRSSFSYNRYLEEVEKCSKPGLVTEKKAYFEAQFRKKGIPCLGSPESHHDNEPSEKTSYDGVNSRMNVGMHSSQYDESPDGSMHGSEHQVMEHGIELSCDGINNVEEAHQVVLESVISTHSRSEIEVKESPDDTSSQLNVKEEAKHMLRTGLVHEVSAPQNLRCISRKEAYTGSERNPCKTVHKLLVRSKAEKKTSQTSAQDKHIPKDEHGSKGKGINVIRRGDKETRNRGIEVPQTTTLRKFPSRVRQSENRIMPTVGVNQPCIKQGSSRFSFNCNGREERGKEEKADAEIKKVQKSLNFKAKPLPSFYRGNPDRNKPIAPTIESRLLLQTKSSRTGSRVSDAQQASGATSCHSTVTSDSTPSSPASQGHDLSLAVVNSRVGVKKDKDKHTRLPQHKAPQENKTTYKGKKMDGKQKKRTEVAKSTLQTRIVQR